MKQKVKSAPKELVRRGLDDGTERLRGQLRDTAQRGQQADDYGGDRIEDAAAGGARRTVRGAERGAEALLKRKKKDKGRISDEGSRAPSGPPEPLSEPPVAPEPPAEPVPQESPRIKTREAVTAREGGTALSVRGRTEPPPAAGSERQRIKMRDSAVQDTKADTPLVPQDATEAPRIRTREAAVRDARDSSVSAPQTASERQQIKIRKPTVRDAHADEPLAPLGETESPQIRTRETAIHDLTAAGESTPQTLSERQRIKIRKPTVRDAHADTPLGSLEGTDSPQIKTRESAVCDVRVNAGVDPQAAPEAPQIKTRDVVTDVPPGHTATAITPRESRPPDRLAIKTKDAYIQRQPTTAPDRPSQAFVQGQQSFIREQGRKAAVKRSEAQRIGNGAVPQVRGGEDAASPAPMRKANASTHSITQAVSPGSPDTQPVREGGNAIVKTARSVKKVPGRAAGHAVKTAERSSRKTIKTTRRTAKAAGRTVKTAQKTAKATVKATQQTVRTARAAAKAAAITAKAAVKATLVAVKAAIAALQALAGAIAAGGWVAIVIVLVLCLAGFLIASPFGIFFSDGGSPDAVSPSVAVAQINQEYADTLSGLQAGGSYDSAEIVGRPPSWGDVFAVFAVKTVTEDGMDVVILDAERVERLRTVFWDMTKITTETKTVDHPATDDTEAWTETVLVITVTPRTVDDMRVFYAFTEEQNELLDQLLAADSRDLWNQLLYGSAEEIVAMALSQVGNVGGQIYWSWYGFSDHVNWCACFVSWCANECGYIDAGIIPRFSSCTAGSNWFMNRGQWKDNRYEPRPGDLIFFDWDRKGSSGPQDDVPDHVGIVERVENGVVYTVEGNTSDSCRQRSYSVGHYEIWGYATPIY